MTTRASIASRIRALSPRTILALGWIGLLLYGFPGHMSYDSVAQLLEARAGVFSDGHPPAMAALWRAVDSVIAGPAGMLLIQSLAFLVGAYLLFRRRMSPRAAAITASLLLWFPVVSNTMSTIWKDSQMAAFLVLGTALILHERRHIKVLGLLSFLVGTAMRHNAFAMTFPIIALLFVWNPTHRWWTRYALALVAWFAVTLSAQLLTRVLTDEPRYIWHQSLALMDMVGTLRNEPPLSDEQLAQRFAGIEVRPDDHFDEALRRTNNPAGSQVENLWWATDSFFVRPHTSEQRAAVVKAWKATVPSNLGGYLTYRWAVFRELLQLTDLPLGSPTYLWFTDIQDLTKSAAQIDHNAWPSKLQQHLHEAMWRLGDTFLFHIPFYLLLAAVLLPFCIRDRDVFAILASGLTSEAALFFLTPTTDFRYSFWLLLATLISLVLVIARRISSVAPRRDDRAAPTG